MAGSGVFADGFGVEGPDGAFVEIVMVGGEWAFFGSEREGDFVGLRDRDWNFRVEGR